ncbi:MAG: cob(I)yrinic acid a,c-diamide adenosyltransferase [Fusobacteriota bacterium]
MSKKLIQVYFGDGKGKTTAAIGQAIRGAGAGMHVAFVQFLKNGSSSEISILKSIKNIDVYIINSNKKFLWELENLDKIKDETRKGLKNIKEIINKDNIDMLILDEVLHLIENEIISEQELLDLVYNKDIEIVITGKKIGKKIKKYGDIITNMKKIKHVYDKGVKAKKGIEF